MNIIFQITELCCLRDDLRQLMGIAQQLEPYIKSITGMMEQIQPEVGRSVNQTVSTADQQTQQQSGQSSSGQVNQQQQQTSQQQPSLQPKTPTYSGNTNAPPPSTAPPANFQKQQLFDPATTTAPLLPERIQTSLSLAEYKAR